MITGKEFAKAALQNHSRPFTRIKAGHPMAEQDSFETTMNERRTIHPGRVRALLARRRTQHEVREQREADIKRRVATQLRAMIRTLEFEAAQLDRSISSELELARVRDPSHFGYPISVRTMTLRRDNLKSSIVALSERLAVTDDELVRSVPEPKSVQKVFEKIGQTG
jgi:hypothetical protein